MKKLTAFFISIGISNLAFSQSDPALNIEGFKYKTISFAEYIKEVHQNNVSINSKQLSLLSSKAMVAPMALIESTERENAIVVMCISFNSAEIFSSE